MADEKYIRITEKFLTLLDSKRGRIAIFKALKEKVDKEEKESEQKLRIGGKFGVNIYEITDIHWMGFEVTIKRMYGGKIITRYRADGSIESIIRKPSEEHQNRFKVYTDLFIPEMFNVDTEVSIWKNQHM